VCIKLDVLILHIPPYWLLPEDGDLSLWHVQGFIIIFNLQFYTIDVHVLVHTTITSTVQELNNVIQLADNIHQHVTLATKGINLSSQKYVSLFPVTTFIGGSFLVQPSTTLKTQSEFTYFSV
jgi:hypothetical protein